MRKAGLERRLHPHAFRATLAVEMCIEGVPLPAIRDTLGLQGLDGPARRRLWWSALSIREISMRAALAIREHRDAERSLRRGTRGGFAAGAGDRRTLAPADMLALQRTAGN